MYTVRGEEERKKHSPFGSVQGVLRGGVEEGVQGGARAGVELGVGGFSFKNFRNLPIR